MYHGLHFIYWTNSGSDTIGRANLDGTSQNQSFITGANNPGWVAVDGSYIYWTTYPTAMIARASLDGTGVKLNFITGLESLGGVAVDQSFVYWVDEAANTIGRANRDGTGVNNSFITGVGVPDTVAVLTTGGAALPLAWLPVAYPGNPPDNPANCFGTNCGSVPYAYDISQYQVTNAQYTEFLNAMAASDPLGLYSPAMGSDLRSGGVTRSVVSGSYTYAVKPFFQNKPVNYVSFYSALRFANWMNNGQGAGDTETGSYTLLGGTPVPSNAATITRNAEGNVFLPSENEWYKAAYFSPAGGYFAYPYGSNTPTTCAQSGPLANTANCGNAVDQVTDVGSYTGAQSPVGAFDLGGNLKEWTDGIVSGNSVVRGASWSEGNLASGSHQSLTPTTASNTLGFRVVHVPALASCGLGSELPLVLLPLLWLRGWRMRKRA